MIDFNIKMIYIKASMKTPELLAPAGSPEALDAAIGEGADAVYLGLKDFNARMRSANFTYAQFEAALRALHRMGKKVYVTVNTVFEQREADRMYQFLKYLSQQGPDALIVQDFGVIAMAKTEFPSLRLHASTQMNIASARGANALSKHGVSRVVLARELSLNELVSIKKETNLELEVFVHGALCVSVSGICLFSSYLGGKSANRGMCTQACRRLYHQFYESHNAGRQNENMRGYYFSPNDLQLLERVPDLAEAGIKALKIEGRMKSASYVGAVVSAYRLVIDAIAGGNDMEEIRRSIETGQEILRNDFARAKTEYLFNENFFMESSHRDAAAQSKIDWLNPDQDGGTGISLGTIQKIKGSGDERCALVTPPRGIKLSARDSVRIHLSDDSGRISHRLTSAEPAVKKSKRNEVWISSPEGLPGDHVYLIQTKEMRKRYAPIIPNVSGGRGPGRDRAPTVQITVNKQEIFPEGLYTAVSRPDDLYIVQSSRPQRVMLSMSRKNIKQLLTGNKNGGKPLPFKPSEIILIFEPFFPQAAACYENSAMTDNIRLLIENGYNQFIVNNPGQFSLFRDFSNVKLIAGPWLYMFNSWSLSFISSLGADGFVSPLENNRQNLEKTLGSDKRLRRKFFITVFAWPQLFTIRPDPGSVLNFNKFSDNMNGNFTLLKGSGAGEDSLVLPQKYFSITDKIPFLKESGFGRFIIDLRGPALKKTNYRDLMRSVSECTALPDSCRFNWKDGFYSDQ